MQSLVKLFDWLNAHTAVIGLVAGALVWLYRNTSHWRRKRELERQREREAAAKVQAEATRKEMDRWYLPLDRFTAFEQEQRGSIEGIKEELRDQVDRLVDRCNCQDTMLEDFRRSVKEDFANFLQLVRATKLSAAKKPRAK